MSCLTYFTVAAVLILRATDSSYVNYFKCDFEDKDTCLLKLSDDSDFGWSVSEYFAPLNLTRGATGTSNFALLWGTAKSVGAKAVLQTPYFKEGNYRLSFAGKGSGDVKLTVNAVTKGAVFESGVIQTRSFSYPSDTTWQTVVMTFRAYSTFRIEFVGLVMSGSNEGNYAIDEIQLEVDDSLPVDLKDSYVYRCDFTYGSMCGLVQLSEPYDDMDWRILVNRPTSAFTGPHCGHTSCKKGDYFALLVADGKPSDIAKLVTPKFNSPSKCLKISFWYYTKGHSFADIHVGAGTSVSTLKRMFEPSSDIDVNNFSDNHTFWRRFIDTVKDNQRIVFEGTLFSSFTDVAIDDIEISDCDGFAGWYNLHSNRAKGPVTINFDDDVATPVHQPTDDTADWTMTTSGGKRLSGLNSGHTCRGENSYCPDGDHYAYFVPADHMGSGFPQYAVMETPNGYTSRDSCITVGMWYYYVDRSERNQGGKLSIVYRKPSETKWNKAWTIEHNGLEAWRYTRVDIKSDRIIIGFMASVTSGDDRDSKYAVDDITIVDCDDKPAGALKKYSSTHFERDGQHRMYYFYSGGSIWSPNFADDYPPDSTYIWDIYIEKENTISILFDDFYTEDDDILRVEDLQYGEKYVYPIEQLSGYSTIYQSRNLYARSHYIRLNFTTDSGFQTMGFKLYWHRVGPNLGSLGQLNNAPDPDYSEGLSPGAISGIVIGSVAGLIFCYCCCCRRKKKDSPQQPNTAAASTQNGNPTQVPGTTTSPGSDLYVSYSNLQDANVVIEPGTQGEGQNDPWAPPSYLQYAPPPNSQGYTAPSAPPMDSNIQPGTDESIPPPPSYESMYGKT